MRILIRAIVTVTLFFVIQRECFPQGAPAVPFLLISSSPETNGMGGVSSASVSMHPMAPLGNVGQIGLFAMDNFVNGGIYASKTFPFASYGYSEISYQVVAFNAGFNLRDLFDVPVPLSVGVGYGRISFDLGEFAITSSAGPSIIGTFKSYEVCDNIILGAGIDSWVRFGFGVNFKMINSHLSPIGTEAEQGSGSASASAYDVGAILQVPVTEIISRLGTGLSVLPGKTRPVLDLTMGYAKRTIGDGISYVAGVESDLLPRAAALGVGIEFGFESRIIGEGWRILGVTISREADAVLVSRSPDGSWSYVSGSGPIRFIDNVIGGKSSPLITQRKGWRLDCAEIFSFRGGSVAENQGVYSTAGWGLRLSGLCKLISVVAGDLGNSLPGFLLKNIDVQYDHAHYTYAPAAREGPSYSSISLVLRKMPF